MNDTEVLIRLPDRVYYGIEKGITVNGSIASQIVLEAVRNGILLPKGHGNLKDVDHYIKMEWEHPDYSLEDEPIIIEADEE